jgi:hypothetical protein
LYIEKLDSRSSITLSLAQSLGEGLMDDEIWAAIDVKNLLKQLAISFELVKVTLSAIKELILFLSL